MNFIISDTSKFVETPVKEHETHLIIKKKNSPLATYIKEDMKEYGKEVPTSLKQQEVFLVNCMANSSKSCGYDGISVKFLKIATKVILPVLTNLFNASFELRVFLSSSKIVKIKPVYKKDDKTNPTNYKPIFFSS